jgi:hypothetical protein
LIDRELKALRGTGATVLFSGVKEAPIGEAFATREVETVFFDVHSGARYLVRQGEIVKPLSEAVEAAGNGGESGHVSKSYYFGTGGN